MERQICLAAGMLTDVPSPVAQIRTAVDAGYHGLGLRVDPDSADWRDLSTVRALLGSTGALLLDVEMVMMTEDGRHDRLAAQATTVAVELGARHLVVVCFDEDLGRCAAGLQDLVTRLEGTDVRPVVEFLPFSHVRSLAAARRLISDAGLTGRVGVLVDVLHLVRSGSGPDEVMSTPPEWLPYLQVCDAGPSPDESTRGALFAEAVRGRCLPGEGVLPVRAIIEAVPADAPLSVEVLSERLMQDLNPFDRAVRALAATRAMMDDRWAGTEATDQGGSQA